MATYVNDLRLKEIANGDESGTWGTSTNTNLELIGEALGFGTEAITTNANTHTSTVADGSTDPARAMYIKYTGTLDSACTITIGPNTMTRVHIIENATSGSQNIIIKQGSGATVTIGNGNVKVVFLDGAGSGAAVTDALIDLELADVASATIASVDINGGTIDGATIATSDITVGSGKTLDISAGTLTLANDQISGNKINGGTIGSVTISSLTATTADINGGTADNVVIGGSTAAAGTFTNIVSNGKTVGTQSIVSTNPTDASGFPDGHVFYVIS